MSELIVGIVGKPNVGKSTLFNAITMSSVPVANYPFTTIEPNVGVAYVKRRCVCREFGVKDSPRNSYCVGGFRFVPFKVVDTAGLVPGAWKGRGLGNQFLDKISRARALIHVVDASGSTDLEGNVVERGSHDPLEDARFLEEELARWLFGVIMRDWDRISIKCETARTPIHVGLYEKLSGLEFEVFQVKEAVELVGKDPHKPSSWTDDDVLEFTRILISKFRPIVIAANKSENEVAEENVARLRDYGYDVVPISAMSELILRRISSLEIVKYLPGDSDFEIVDEGGLSGEQLRALGRIRREVMERWGGTGVQQLLNHVVFDKLRWIVVYPVRNPEDLSDAEGNVLPDAYLLPPGSSAREVAHRIHSELAKRMKYVIDIRRKIRRNIDYSLENDDVICIVTE